MDFEFFQVLKLCYWTIRDWCYNKRKHLVYFLAFVFIAIVLVGGAINVFAEGSDDELFYTPSDPETETLTEPPLTEPTSEAPVLLTANNVTSSAPASWSPYADCTNSDSVASVLYDSAQTDMRPFNNFILYRSGNYQYTMIYGNIDNDFSFSGATVLVCDYSYSSGSNHRYSFSKSSDVDGTFNPNQFTFLSNLDSEYALNNQNYIENHHSYSTMVACICLAILFIVSKFTFARRSLS